MIIHALTAKNIGPFARGFSIDTAGLESIVAVAGHNGAGKTFLLECIPGALYGVFPFRMVGQGETIYDMINTPGIPASLELEFTFAEKRYRIERHLKVTGAWTGNTFRESAKNQTVIISELVDDEWIPRAEKARAVDEFVEHEICPLSLFLASCFNSQNSAGDLVDKPQDERKKIFVGIIGMGELEEKAALFSSRVKFIDMRLSEKSIVIENEKSRLENVDELHDGIIIANEKLLVLAGRMNAQKTILESLMKRRAAYAGIADEIKSLESRIGEALNRRGEIDLKISRAHNLIAGRDAATGHMDEIAELRAGLDALEADRAEHEQAAREYSDLGQQISDLKTERQKLLRESDAIVAKFKQNVRDLETRRDKLSLKAREMDRHIRQAAILDTLDCPKNCAYVADARASAEYMGECRAKINGADPREYLHEKIAGIEKQINEKNNELITASAELARESCCSKIDGQIAGLGHRQYELLPELKAAEEIKSKISAARGRIALLEKTNPAADLARIEDAENELPMLESERTTVANSIAELSEKLECVKSNRANDPAPEIRAAEQEIKSIESETDGYKKIIIERQLRLDGHERAEQRINELTFSTAGLGELRGAYMRLAEAFGRSGIQALVIDSEKSQFLEIASELFGILSGGKMALHFSTQKTLKSGDVREDFNLSLAVDGVTRKLEQCSQGQQDLGRIVMRATLGIYHAIKSGSRMRTYFLDETTGALDEINRENYYEFLKFLTKYFKQIFVVSHQDIVKSIPCQIKITDNHEVKIA